MVENNTDNIINKQTESQILHAIIVYIAELKIGKVIRNQVGGYKGSNGKYIRYGTPGESDLTVELDNSTINLYLEVKSAKGKPTQKQIDFLERQKNRGNRTAIVHSVKEVEEKLKEWSII
jgi:hypothetical protein